MGLSDGRLRPCPDSPNCVSSDAQDAHAIAPFRLKGDPVRAWEVLREALGQIPRVTVVVRTSDYLHATFTTRWLRFVDDVEFQLRAAEGIVALRSASRVGYLDFGTNRRRIEWLRERLRGAGTVE